MSDFVARTSDEWALRQFIAVNAAEAGHVDVEMVISGEGISNIYKWLRSTAEPSSLNLEVDAAVMAATEPAAVISQHGGGGGDAQGGAQDGGAAAAAVAADPLCARAIGMFLAALGTEAGNLAVRYQATGGVFIAGGGKDHRPSHTIMQVEQYLVLPAVRPPPAGATPRSPSADSLVCQYGIGAAPGLTCGLLRCAPACSLFIRWCRNCVEAAIGGDGRPGRGGVQSEGPLLRVLRHVPSLRGDDVGRRARDARGLAVRMRARGRQQLCCQRRPERRAMRWNPMGNALRAQQLLIHTV